jgi:Carboxypeptidase regulatory-like domain
MNLRMARLVLQTGIFLPLLCAPNFAPAQLATVLYGTVTDQAGKPVANAQVTARNAQVNQPVQAVTDSSGNYTLPPLMPGPCSVSVTASGFTANESKVDCTGTGRQLFNITLSAAQPPLPNAPAPASAPAPTAPSLADLGFGQQQTQADPKLQAMLDKHTEMLRIHQRLGLITVGPLAADLITGPMAKAKGKNGETITEPSNLNLDLHAALGGTTVALYASTAYFAIFAPRIPGEKKHGAIRMHEALAFIHGPGMVLTPILGAMAFQQEQDGEKVHGIASAHGAVAYTTAIAYGAAIVAVSWPIHLKFWEK